MIERKHQRRKGGPLDAPAADQRRKNFERRGTRTQGPAPTLGQQLYGERRKQPGME